MRQWISLIFVAIIISCGASHPDENTFHNNWPNRSQLFDNFRNSQACIVVYNNEDYLVTDQLKLSIDELSEFPDRMKFVLKKDDEVTEEDFKNFPVYIAGTHNNLLIKRLDGNIPVDLLENGFVFDGKDYTDKSDIIRISFYPNPFNPKLPITIILGNDQVYITDYIKSTSKNDWGGMFFDSWGYQVIHQKKRVLIGNFSEDSSSLWTVDKKLYYEFDYTGTLVATDKNFKIFDHSSGNTDAQFTSYVFRLQSELESIGDMTGVKSDKIYTVHICPSVEAMGLAFNFAGQTYIDPGENIIYTVINQEYSGISNGYELLPAIGDEFGKTEITALEKGLAVYFTPNWQERGFGYWGNKLNCAGAFPDLDELLNNELYNMNSPVIIDCMAAVFVDFLIEAKGKEYLTAQYSKLTKNDLLALKTDWIKYLDKNYMHPQADNDKISFKSDFLQGFNFAHEGYDVYNGYLGSLASLSIEKLKSIGCNSIALLPYSGFRSMEDPHPFRISHGAGGENDAAIIRSAYKSEQLGFAVMLKPQVWSWKGWTGDIAMSSEEEWDLFFKYYDEWIMHYALLAEIHHVEIFCAGVEFKNATLTHEKKWIELFDKIRKVYSGKITYAANWGEEFEGVSFWDHLDYIGLNCYYPLSSKENPTDEELKAQMEKNLDRIENVVKKYKKPILFTEIGFKSIDHPWINPANDDNEQICSEESQRRCYEAMFRAMEDEKWISGIYIWKWPSYMDYSKMNEKDFNPCGKAAEKTIEAWFAKSNQ